MQGPGNLNPNCNALLTPTPTPQEIDALQNECGSLAKELAEKREIELLQVSEVAS